MPRIIFAVRLSVVPFAFALLIAATAAAESTGSAAAAAAPAAPVKELSLERRVSPEELALQQIVAEGRAKSEDLLAQAQGDPLRLELAQREIAKIRTETDLRYLQKKLEFARARGDAAQVATLEQALAQKLAAAPPVPAAAPAAPAEPKTPEVGK